VLLVVFIIRIYHDARSPESQTVQTFVWMASREQTSGNTWSYGYGVKRCVSGWIGSLSVSIKGTCDRGVKFMAFL